MDVFYIFEIIYYIFFGLLFIIAFKVFFDLISLSKKIKNIDQSNVINNIKDFKSVETFILTNSPNFPLSALIKILPGTFIGFGILGTFLGFSNGIAGMRLTENVDLLFGKLDSFFQGLNTAFITSIVGVVFSVLFGTLLYQWPLNKIKFHCSHIYENNKSEFSPKESAEEEFGLYIDSLRKMTKGLIIAKTSIELLPEKFKEVGLQLEKSIAPVNKTFSSMQATLENYSEQAKSLQSASEQIQATLSTFIDKSEQTTSRVNDSLEKSIDVTKQIQDNNIKVSQQMMTAHNSMLEEYKEIDERLSSILETVNTNLTQYSQTMEKTLVQTLEEYNKTAQKVTEAFFGEKNE
ncbi:MAG: hypothetical protein MJ160_05890 [Treponema sp.]|nr:hypothetical protein [Treponema sp.]